MDALIELRHLSKKYFVGLPNELEVLHGLNLKIYPGEFVAIVGESGSGKSTLMNIIGALDQPTDGEYILNGVNIKDLSEKEKARIRNKEVGFVFQNFNLIGRSTALKNVELPMLYAKVPTKERIQRASEYLSLVNMEDRMHHLPNELSGGQKQRVAIARALSNRPSLILADEPTGALDSQTSLQIMKILKDLHQETHTTILIITHSHEVAKACLRIITLKDGNIISDINQGEMYER